MVKRLRSWLHRQWMALAHRTYYSAAVAFRAEEDAAGVPHLYAEQANEETGDLEWVELLAPSA